MDGISVLTAVTDVAGKTIDYAYDARGRLAEVIDQNGNTVVRNEYDDTSGRVARQWDQLGNLSTFDWSPETTTAQMTDAAGATRTHVYEGFALGAATDAAGTTLEDHDEDGNLIRTQLANGTSVTQDFTDRGLPESIVAAGAGTEVTRSFDWTSENLLESAVDGRGNPTTYGYDGSGNLTSVDRPDDTSVSLHYEDSGRLRRVVEADESETLLSYDGDGNVTAIEAPGGATTTYEYDELSRVSRVVPPDGNEPGADPDEFATTYDYDARGDVTHIDGPAGAVEVTYDDKGNVLTRTDALGLVTEYAYNAADEVIGVPRRSADGSYDVSSQFEYDERGHLMKGTDPSGLVTTYAYDGAGRRTSKVDPAGNVPGLSEEEIEGHRWHYRYDPVGNVGSIVVSVGRWPGDELDPPQLSHAGKEAWRGDSARETRCTRQRPPAWRVGASI